MIGHRDLHTTAANPNFEMGTLYVRQNSAANVALLDVPRRSGIAITRVWMRVTNCDGETADYDAVRTGTMWVVDVPGTHFATPGEVPGGVDVWASGDGADGEPYAWSIGTGALCVREGDSGTPAPGDPWTAIKLRETVPDNPAYGDAKIDGGALYVWDGTRWVGGGGGGIVDPALDPTSSNAVANSAVCGGLDGKLDKSSDNYAFNDTIGGLEVQVEDYGGQTSSHYVFSRAGGGTANTVARMSDIPAVPTASTSAPVPDGTASAGSSAAYARGDHRHPTDTTRAAASALTALAQTVTGKLDSSVTDAYSITVASGHLTVTDSQSNATYVFAGPVTNPDDVARGEDLPYTTGIVMDESEGVYFPVDRAVNAYEATDGDTTLTLNMPQPMAVDQGGKARDFIIDVDNSANTSALGLEFEALGEDYALAVTDGDDLAEITELAAGERARFYFTETSQWYTPTGAQDPVPVISIQRMTIEVVTTQGGA